MKKTDRDIRDTFKISDGNIIVLSNIPYMMSDKVYRTKLRLLVMDFMFNNKTKKEVKNEHRL